MWFACKKYHPTYGIPGTEIRGETLAEQFVDLGRGWEWWPSVLWQFIWSWMVRLVCLLLPPFAKFNSLLPSSYGERGIFGTHWAGGLRLLAVVSLGAYFMPESHCATTDSDHLQSPRGTDVLNILICAGFRIH